VDDLDDVFWIEDADTLDVIADPVRMEILEQLAEAKTVKELAQDMEVPRTRLYHHIGLLVDAGVIRVVESREVGALTERIYRVSAKSYQPSPKMLESIEPRKQAQVILDSLFATTRADVIRSVEEGLVTFEESADERTVEVSRRGFRLAPEKLSELIGEIGELFARYADLDHTDGLGVAALTVVYPTTRRM